MSSIDKLLIQGVRSFSPDKHAVIEFMHPLTLIVGPNGSGKTVRRSLPSSPASNVFQASVHGVFLLIRVDV